MDATLGVNGDGGGARHYFLLPLDANREIRERDFYPVWVLQLERACDAIHSNSARSFLRAKEGNVFPAEPFRPSNPILLPRNIRPKWEPTSFILLGNRLINFYG